MAYRHEDDYRREKLIRKQRTSKKPTIDPESKSLLEAKHVQKLKESKGDIFRCGNERVSHIERQKERRSTGRYKDLTRDYDTKGK